MTRRVDTSRRAFLQNAGAIAAAGMLGPIAAGGATPRKRPNILFFFPDQHRPDWIGLEGRVPVPTPNLDALARRGAHLTKTFCPSPLCAPSRACLATGREYDRCGVRDNEGDLPAGTPTIFRRLRDGGYHVMGVGKIDLAKGSRTWGLDGKLHQEAWGFSDLADCCGKIDGMLAYYGVRSWADVRPRAGQEGKRPQPEEPYLAYLDSLDPPRAREFADDMLARVKGRRVELVRGSGPQTTFSRPFGPEPQLFDLDDDPSEDRNLAAELPRVVKRLSELLPLVAGEGSQS